MINAVNTVFFISFNNNTHYTQQFNTARKRSLPQGNIFANVSHSFCPRGGGVLPSQHALGREVDFPLCIVRGKGIGFPACITVYMTGGRGSASRGREFVSGERGVSIWWERGSASEGRGGALHLMGVCIQGRGSASGSVCI